jgi:hypothetical protein
MMMDQLTIIKSQLSKITDELVNYPEARDAINYIIAANQNLALAKTALSKIKNNKK